MAAYQIGDGNPDGIVVGASASKKVAFFGATATTQPATIADATDAATAITKCNAVIATMKTLGLIASS